MSSLDSARFSDTTAPQHLVDGRRETPVRLVRLGVSLAVGVAAFDVCFWNVDQPGLCVALFFPMLAALILANREKQHPTGTILVLLLLLAGAAVAATIETCFTNSVIFGVLILALGGETFFTERGSGWARWVPQVVSWFCAPGRPFWLAARIIELVSRRKGGWAGRIAGGCLLVLPAVVLAFIFGSLLASGNAVFSSWAESFLGWIDHLVAFLNVARTLFWVMGGLFILPLLRPAEVSSWWWEGVQHPRRVPELISARAAVAASALILIVLNLLFLVANSADALFLWSGTTLPTAVAYKAYVHEGVDTLIFTVILTAVVLTIIFQQAPVVVRRPVLHRLALVWIIQNLFLLMSCALRLKDYIETFGMTTKRLSALLFLVLVAAGFFLLTVKIRRDKSLSWLVGGCLVATFSIFYVAQFLDLAGWSANYNVARWEKDRAFPLNRAFSFSGGVSPAAIWPALRRAGDPSSALPRGDVPVLENWREFSGRAWLNRWALEDDPKK